MFIEPDAQRDYGTVSTYATPMDNVSQRVPPPPTDVGGIYRARGAWAGAGVGLGK